MSKSSREDVPSLPQKWIFIYQPPSSRFTGLTKIQLFRALGLCALALSHSEHRFMVYQ